MTANSPGEIAGWMRPVLDEWQKVAADVPVVVILLPCTFATGREAEVAAALPGVERVVPAAEYPRLLASEGARYATCPLLHLGGDLMYTAFLSWRWKLRAWSYLWARPWWDTAFEGYFTRDGAGVHWLLKRRIPHAKIQVCGDLVVDSVACRTAVKPVQDNLITFLPGSRAEEAATLTPFFLETARRLRAERPDLQFQLMLSPFLEPGRFQALLEAEPHPRMAGLQGVLQEDNLVSPDGTRLRVVHEVEALAGSRLAVTLPGTKTGEAGSLGVPCLTLLPLNRPEELPYIGLLGLLDWLPGGAELKGRYLVTLKGRIGLVAQPNILAGRALMPEVVDVLSPEGVAADVLGLLKQQPHLDQVRSQLLQLYAPSRGAAARIVAAMACRSS